jgi:uncharacterized membrane protein
MSRKKYEISRHHAWAGTALLSVLLAFRLVFSLPNEIVMPIAFFLIVYILISLFFTYKYHKALSQALKAKGEEAKSEKEKLEKKRIKAEAKVKKKMIKKL